MLRCITCDCRQSKKFLVQNTPYCIFKADSEWLVKNTNTNEIKVLNSIIEQFKDDNVIIVCPYCNGKYNIHTLVDAYNQPLAIFDEDALCDCGGTIDEIINHDNQLNKQYLIKQCNKCNKKY